MLKRPYVDEFLQRMGEMFECVLFTASLAKVLKQLLDQIFMFNSACVSTCSLVLQMFDLLYFICLVPL